MYESPIPSDIHPKMKGTHDFRTPLVSGGSLRANPDMSYFRSSNSKNNMFVHRMDSDFTVADDQQTFTPTAKIITAPFRNGEDKLLQIGTFAFIYEPKNTIDRPSAQFYRAETVAAIFTVNHYLEQGSIQAMNRRKPSKGVLRAATNTEHGSGGGTNAYHAQARVWSGMRFWAEEVEEARKWKALGVIVSINNMEGKERIMGYALDKPVRATNLWYDADIGDRVGFILKMVNNRHPKTYDSLGRETGSREDFSDVIQIIPYTEKSCKAPYNNCGEDPVTGDHSGTKYVVKKALSTKEYIICRKTDPSRGMYAGHVYRGKFMDPNKRLIETNPVDYELTEYGYWSSVGIVVDIYGAKPTQQEALLATRSEKAHSQLWNDGKKLSISVKRSDTV